MKRRSVIIIGAGTCGLAAAERLSEEFDVTILEALDRTGGRIHTLRDETGEKILEAGAEFIHGRLPLTLEIAEKAGALLEKVDGNMYRVSKCVWKEQEDMIEGWDDLLYNMNAAPEDITLDAFLETYYPENEYASLRRHTREYAAGFDLADPTKASIKALYR